MIIFIQLKLSNHLHVHVKFANEDEFHVFSVCTLCNRPRVPFQNYLLHIESFTVTTLSYEVDILELSKYKSDKGATLYFVKTLKI